MWERRLLCGYLDIDISIHVQLHTHLPIGNPPKKGRDFQLDLWVCEFTSRKHYKYFHFMMNPQLRCWFQHNFTFTTKVGEDNPPPENSNVTLKKCRFTRKSSSNQHFSIFFMSRGPWVEIKKKNSSTSGDWDHGSLHNFWCCWIWPLWIRGPDSGHIHIRFSASQREGREGWFEGKEEEKEESLVLVDYFVAGEGFFCLDSLFYV